jgi:hypothetical protein
MRPVPHKPPANVIVDDEDSATDEADLEWVGETFECYPTFEASCSSSEPHLLTQGDLNDLVCDFNLSKKEAEILVSRLKGWILLQQGTKVCFFATARMNLNVFFSQENDLVFCNDICSVMEALGHQHNTPEWRLFIDSSKVNLKAVLLRNRNKYLSVPLAHAVDMKESYENMKLLLEKIHYEKYK